MPTRPPPVRPHLSGRLTRQTPAHSPSHVGQDPHPIWLRCLRVPHGVSGLSVPHLVLPQRKGPNQRPRPQGHTPTRTWENRPQPKGAFGWGDAADNAVEQEADLLSLS